MDSALLVFASKRVGSGILQYLADSGAPISRLYILEEDDEVRAAAERLGLPILFYTDQTAAELAHGSVHFSWMLNLWFPKIFKTDILSLADRRLNVHPSLAPHCRGNDCAAWAIRTDAPAGVSLLEITEGVDTGEVYAQREVPVAAATRGKDLHIALQDAAIELFIDEWPAIQSGAVSIRAQTDGGSYFRRADTDADRRRAGTETLTIAEAVNWIRAHDFSPGTTAEMELNGRRYKLSLEIEEIRDPLGSSEQT